MARHNYKLALRAKGIRPIPPYHRLRTRKDGPGEHHEIAPDYRPFPPYRVVKYRGFLWRVYDLDAKRKV